MLDPCGNIIDYLRSTYATKMRMRVGDSPVSVEWKKAAPGAPFFPFPTCFFSHNWDERNYLADVCGEQDGPKPYTKGPPQERFTLSGPCKKWEPFWKFGIPAGMSGPPVDANGVPKCCSNRNCFCDDEPMPLTMYAIIQTLLFPCSSGVENLRWTLKLQPDCSYRGFAQPTFFITSFELILTPTDETPTHYNLLMRWTDLSGVYIVPVGSVEWDCINLQASYSFLGAFPVFCFQPISVELSQFPFP